MKGKLSTKLSNYLLLYSCHQVITHMHTLCMSLSYKNCLTLTNLSSKGLLLCMKSTSFQKYLLAVKKDSLKRSLAWRVRKKRCPSFKSKTFLRSHDYLMLKLLYFIDVCKMYKLQITSKGSSSLLNFYKNVHNISFQYIFLL